LAKKSSEDQESLVMCFDTDIGNIFMNIAMRYNRRRRHDSQPRIILFQLQPKRRPVGRLFDRF